MRVEVRKVGRSIAREGIVARDRFRSTCDDAGAGETRQEGGDRGCDVQGHRVAVLTIGNGQ